MPLPLSLALLFLSQGSALASTPVLHAGEDPRLLLAKAAAATEYPAEELRVLTFLELGRGKPSMMLGGGRVESCRGAPSTDAGLRDAVDRVERALSYMEMEKAVAHIQVGEDAVSCLSVPADARRVARLAFLKGFMAFDEGDEATARESFEVAHTIEPGMAWDNNYPPDAKDLFDAVAAEVTARQTLPVRVVPLPADGVVWVDGQRRVAQDGHVLLTPGRHLVQIPGMQMTSLWLTLKAPEASAEAAPEAEATASTRDAPTLIVPSAMANDAAMWALDPARRDALDQVLGVLYDPDTMVYFSAEGVLFAHPVGTEQWQELTVPSGFSGSGVAGRLVAGRSLMWSGAVGTGGGLLLAGVSWTQANSASRAAASDLQWVDYSAEQQKYEAAGDRMSVARWVMLSGVVLGSGGLALQFDELPFKRGNKAKASASLAPMWAPGSAEEGALGGAVLTLTGW